MTEILHEMIRYGTHIKDVICCGCFYDEVYFMLRHKTNYQTFEEKFGKLENCYFHMIYGSFIVVCYDVLFYTSQKYNLFDRKKCITDLVNTKPIKTEVCSICVVDVFRKNNILYTFNLKW